MKVAAGEVLLGGGSSASNNFAWRSEEQQQLAEEAALGSTPVVVAVLPVSQGKSVAFSLAEKFDTLVREEQVLGAATSGGGGGDAGEAHLRVVLLLAPYRILCASHEQVLSGQLGVQAEYVRSAAAARLLQCKYMSAEAPGSQHPRVLIMTPEVLALEATWVLLWQLVGRGTLRHVVVDECHLSLMTAGWRPASVRLGMVRRLGVPVVLMTGTLPPALEPALRSVFFLGRGGGSGDDDDDDDEVVQTRVIRAPMHRSNVRIDVVAAPKGQRKPARPVDPLL